MDGTLDMRPGPIAKKHLGCSRFQVVNKDLNGDDAHINRSAISIGWGVPTDIQKGSKRPITFHARYFSGWFVPDFLILLIDIVLFVMTARLGFSNPDATSQEIGGFDHPNKASSWEHF